MPPTPELQGEGCGRLRGKVAIVTGAGQTPGETIGNGRATAILFAREGAKVLLVDRHASSAQETAAMIGERGGEALVVEADVTSADHCDRVVATCRDSYGRVDVLHNNVGIGAAERGPVGLSEDVWDRLMETNLKSMFLMCRAVLPVMREQGGGAIVNVSSLAAVAATPMVAYKVSKAGVNALTQQIAAGNAKYGIRCNAVLPGLIDTPMAVDGFAAALGRPREDVAKMRDELVPMGRQGTAWDVAYAALYLASDEARFVTGVLLAVDGGQGVRIG